MPTHKVQAGDTLFSIAHKHGVRDWRSLYFDAANQELRRLRPDPMQLVAGDSVVIPDPAKPDPAGSGLQCETGQTHVFFVEDAEPAYVRLVLVDEREMPRAGQRYKIEVEGKVLGEGSTGADGQVEVEVPPDARTGKLTLSDAATPPNAESFELKLGRLEPASEAAGVRGRLDNLGFETGDEKSADDLRQALREFQLGNGLPVTGEPDDRTRATLLRLHP